jgi:hypothetical protein
MSVKIEMDKASLTKLNKKLKLMEKHFPNETFRGLSAVMLEIKRIAQNKIKSDGHIVTARLRNSIFVKTKGQKFVKTPGNQKRYSDNKGKSFNADLNVKLDELEGAVGTNVVYAQKIEKLDSFLQYGVNTVNIDKQLKKVEKQALNRIK